MNFRIQVVLILLSTIAYCPLYGQDYLSKGSNYRLYRHFWFENGTQTDTMIARQIINSPNDAYEQNRESWFLFEECRTLKGFDKYVLVDSIYPMNVSQSSDFEIVERFLLSLEMYNLWFGLKKRRGSVDRVHRDLFFKSRLKNAYKAEWIEDGVNYGQVEIKKLSSIEEYNFGHLIYADCQDDECKIYFPPYKTVLTCTKDFYDSLLFPKYLNFISKDHMITGYQITIPKISLEDDRQEKMD